MSGKTVSLGDPNLSPSILRDLTTASATPETFTPATDLISSGFYNLFESSGLPKTALELRKDPSRPNLPLIVGGRQSIELRFFSTLADNAEETWSVYGWGHPYQKPLGGQTGDTQAGLPYGFRLGVLVITYGTQVAGANLHPVTNEAVATTQFRCADTIAPTEFTTDDEAKLCGYALYDADGGDGQARIVLDGSGLFAIYAKCTARTASSTRTIIAARPY